MTHLQEWLLAGAILVATTLSAAAQMSTPPPASAPSNLPPGVKVAVPLLNRATLDAPARQAVIAEELVFKATLKIETPGPSLSGREVKFTVDGAAACAGATNGAGVATCTYKIPPMPQGFHVYEARSAAGGGITSAKADAKLLIAKAQTKLKVFAGGSGDAPLTPGDTISVVAHLSRALDGSLMDGKPVSFEINGAPAGNATTVGGVAKREWKVPTGATGAQKFEAFFVTDDFYVGTSAQVSKGVSRRAYLNVLSGPDGTAGKPMTIRGQIATVPYLPGQKSPNGGIQGRTLMFVFIGYDPDSNNTKALWNWKATTGADGVATATETPGRSATSVRLRLVEPTDGWTADEVGRPWAIEKSETLATAPGISGKIGTNATLKVHVVRKTDGAPRKFAKIRVTKLDQTNLQTPVGFSTDAQGNGSADILVKSQMGIGSHTLTLEIDGDGACKPVKITVPLNVKPSS